MELVRKTQFGVGTLLVVLSVVVALSLGGWVAVGADPGVSPSEPGTTVDQGNSAPAKVTKANTAGLVAQDPSEQGANGPTSLPAGAKSNLAGENSVSAASTGPRWYNVIGSVFVPSNGPTTYSYHVGGCVHSQDAGQWRAPVLLPDGAVVNYIYLNYYNDTSVVSGTVGYLARYDYTGLGEDVGWTGTLTGGQQTGYLYSGNVVSPTVVVNNLNYGYAFVWSGSTNQRLCGMQVGYSGGAVSSFVPNVTRNAPGGN